MADDFLSYMVYFFKALFLKTLKFQLLRYFSLRRWMNFHGIKSNLFIIYVVIDVRVAILRFWCVSIFFMLKTKNSKKWKKLLQKNHFLAWKKYLHIKILKLQLLDPYLHKVWKICFLSHENSSTRLREK